MLPTISILTFSHSLSLLLLGLIFLIDWGKILVLQYVVLLSVNVRLSWSFDEILIEKQGICLNILFWVYELENSALFLFYFLKIKRIYIELWWKFNRFIVYERRLGLLELLIWLLVFILFPIKLAYFRSILFYIGTCLRVRALRVTCTIGTITTCSCFLLW